MSSSRFRIPLFASAILFALPVPASDVQVRQGQYDFMPKQGPGDALPKSGPVIRVYSDDGRQYDFVGGATKSLPFLVDYTGKCSGRRKVDKASATVAGERVEWSAGGGYSDRTVTVPVPPGRLAGLDAVKVCNDTLRTLRAETGKTNAQLIRGGFGVRYENSVDLSGYIRCKLTKIGRGQTDSDREKADVWVSCEPNPKAGQTTAKAKVLKVKPKRAEKLITSMKITASPRSYVGECPKGVLYSGSITVSGPGEVRYRTVGSDGSESPVFGLSFSKAGTKEIVGWGDTYAKPKASGRLSSGGASNGPDYSGWRRIEVVSPAGVGPSDKASFSITCREPSAPVTLKP